MTLFYHWKEHISEGFPSNLSLERTLVLQIHCYWTLFWKLFYSKFNLEFYFSNSFRHPGCIKCRISMYVGPKMSALPVEIVVWDVKVVIWVTVTTSELSNVKLSFNC